MPDGEFHPTPPKKIVPPMERAMRLLGQRAFSERELTLRLRRYDCYRAAEIRETVESCRKHGFLNDELLAEDYAQILSERGSGQRMIRYQLKKRGLAEPHVNAALEKSAESEPEAAKRALEYKLRMLSREADPRKKREKAYRFLASRGFTPDVIRTVFEETNFGTMDTEWEDNI